MACALGREVPGGGPTASGPRCTVAASDATPSTAVPLSNSTTPERPESAKCTAESERPRAHAWWPHSTSNRLGGVRDFSDEFRADPGSCPSGVPRPIRRIGYTFSRGLLRRVRVFALRRLHHRPPGRTPNRMSRGFGHGRPVDSFSGAGTNERVDSGEGPLPVRVRFKDRPSRSWSGPNRKGWGEEIDFSNHRLAPAPTCGRATVRPTNHLELRRTPAADGERRPRGPRGPFTAQVERLRATHLHPRSSCADAVRRDAASRACSWKTGRAEPTSHLLPCSLKLNWQTGIVGRNASNFTEEPSASSPRQADLLKSYPFSGRDGSLIQGARPRAETTWSDTPYDLTYDYGSSSRTFPAR